MLVKQPLRMVQAVKRFLDCLCGDSLNGERGKQLTPPDAGKILIFIAGIQKKGLLELVKGRFKAMGIEGEQGAQNTSKACWDDPLGAG